jgi:branched-chain amino acid aminotransferase
VLPGITRKSTIRLLKELQDGEVLEKEYTMDEVLKALKEKRVLEMFGCGTAAAVCPIKGIFYKEVQYPVPIDEKL